MRAFPTSAHFVSGVALVVGVAVLLAVAAVDAHHALLTQHNDLGNHLQALAAAAGGDVTMPQHNTIDDVARSRFGVHSNWVLLPASLVWRLAPTPETFLLMAVVAAAIASAAMGLLTSRHGALAGVVGAATIIMHPWLHDAVLSDGHLTTWAAALVACAFAWRARRPHLAFACALGALLVKEDMPVIGLAAAVVLALEGQRRGAFALGLASLVVLGVDTVVLRLNDGPAATHRFDWLSSAPPATVLLHLINPAVVRLPLFVLLSGGLLVGRGLRWLLPVVPIVGLCMLDGSAYMTRLAGTHYLPVVVVFVVAAVDAGVAAGASPRRFTVLAGLTVLSSLALSTLPTLAQATPRPELVAAVRMLVADAGLQRARLCVQNNLGPQLDPAAPISAFPRCRPDDPRLFLLRSTAPPDDGLTLRADTATLIGAPLPALLDELDGLVASGARATRHEAGAWLFVPTSTPTPMPLEQRQALREDVERFTHELEARYRERSGLVDGLIRLAVEGRQ